MSQCFIRELPYAADSAELLRRFCPLPDLVFLDSGCGGAMGSNGGRTRRGRYDILSALPAVRLRQDGPRVLRDEQALPPATDIFTAVDNALHDMQHGVAAETISNLPFQGGAIGCFGYRGVARVGIYLWAVIVDHDRQHTLLFALPHCDRHTLQQVLSCLEGEPAEAGAFSLTSPLLSNFDVDSYAAAFERVQDYIHAGDCYQVNLAQRFSARWSGDP